MITIKSKNEMKEDLKNQGTPLIECLLTECSKNEKITVISVNAGYKAKNRLANLGIVPGVKIIKKKTAPFKGPIEIFVKGTSLVLGRGLASKILVKCNNTCNT
ncbi:MAG: ferrous iron transport protein A [Promethearchaeota archaeon]